MADDLVARLRWGPARDDLELARDAMDDAAYRIESLQSRERRLREALYSYANGRCYPCGWPLKATVEEGCVIGNCSYRPSERAHDYEQWHDRAVFISALLSEDAP